MPMYYEVDLLLLYQHATLDPIQLPANNSEAKGNVCIR